MKWFLTLCISASVITLAGCANLVWDVPIKIPRSPVVAQYKMQAAHHWDVLAEYQAKLIMTAIKNTNKPVYVDCVIVGCQNSDPSLQTGANTPFAIAYHSMLQSQLVKKGATVLQAPVPESLRISYTAQVIEHKDRGRFGYTVWDPEYLNVPGNKVVVVPTLRNIRADPVEVIITTQVNDGLLLLHSSTDKFYYNPGDTDHYFVPTLPPPPPLPPYDSVNFQVTDGSEN